MGLSWLVVLSCRLLDVLMVGGLSCGLSCDLACRLRVSVCGRFEVRAVCGWLLLW